MEIVIEHLLEGAKRAKGTVVIIDVYRAATTAANILDRGAEEIILADSFEDAFDQKKNDPSIVLVGEKHGLFVPGFDHGNSPYEASRTDYAGKKVVMKTSSGTAGILAAREADEILFAGFVNAKATARYINEHSPEKVSLVCMGWEGKKETEEDVLCAEYLRDLFLGKTPDYALIKDHLRRADCSQRFFSGNPDWPDKDFYCAVDLDRFDYAMKAEKKGNKTVLVKA
jgi:2-phosphosulfolactate phosphatase